MNTFISDITLLWMNLWPVVKVLAIVLAGAVVLGVGIFVSWLGTKTPVPTEWTIF